MEFAFLLIVFFVLGTLLTYFLQVGKNIAYILFVMILGWGVWQVVGPDIMQGPGTPIENFVALNTKFKQSVSSDLERHAYDPTYDIAGTVERSFRELFDEQKVEEQKEEKADEEIMTYMSAPEKPSFKARLKRKLKDFLITLLEE